MGFADDFDQVVLSPSRKPRTPAGARVVALIVHDEEYPERPTSAEEVAAFFTNPARQASTTGVIDNNSKVGCVPYGETAWHTGAGDPWNYQCEGYEHSGYAHQTRAEWLDPYGIAMLELSAAHYAKRCHALGIPPRRITPNQLALAVRANDPAQGGICGHWDITTAVPVPGGHTDPGPNFPWDYFINRVLAYYGGAPQPNVEDIVTPDDVKTIAAAVEAQGRQLVRDTATGAIYLCHRVAGHKIHLDTDDEVQLLAKQFGLPRDKDGKAIVDDWHPTLLKAFPTAA